MDNSCLGRFWCSVSCCWWARSVHLPAVSVHFSAMPFPTLSQNFKTCGNSLLSWKQCMDIFLLHAKSLVPQNPWKNMNCMVYALLHAGDVMWKEQVSGGTHSSEREHGKSRGCKKKKKEKTESSCIWPSRTCIWMAKSWLVRQSRNIGR